MVPFKKHIFSDKDLGSTHVLFIKHIFTVNKPINHGPTMSLETTKTPYSTAAALVLLG
jgi:hypothetical protein